MLHISPVLPSVNPPPLNQGSQKRSTPRRKTQPKSPMILRKIGSKAGNLLIRDYLERLGTPRSLAVWLMFAHDEHKQLVEYSISSMDYLENPICGLPGPLRFRDDYAASKFLSKCSGLNTGIDLKKTAIDSALKAEALCHSTNKRLIEESFARAVMPDVVQRNFFRITSKIANILGDVPTSFKEVGWSPGRTSSAWGDAATSVHKYASQLDVTLSARGRARELLRDSPIWGAAALDSDGPVSVLSSAFTRVKGNTMITVPKNAKTDRVICYEPHMNIRLQLQVGSYIRSRLGSHGVNLNDQTVNQRRAKLGCKTGSLATIDLSMASDTLCRELVFQLLPIDWAILLDDLRSKYTTWPDGTTRMNEKFSSMGNGFTFELESLIFFALVSAVSDNVSVYGDDIILNNAHFLDAQCVLEWAGFSLNKGKSFHEGNFRESCGFDGFAGFDVTPVYLRKLPKLVEDVVHLHNRIRQWCSKARLPELSFQRMLTGWRNIHTCYHGPSGYGDGHYHIDHDSALHKAGYGLDGWWFKTYTRVFRVNRLYGDRVHGRYSGRFGYGALCATLGPKRNLDVIQATVDRRQWVYQSTRSLASFVWPSINWY